MAVAGSNDVPRRLRVFFGGRWVVSLVTQVECQICYAFDHGIYAVYGISHTPAEQKIMESKVKK